MNYYIKPKMFHISRISSCFTVTDMFTHIQLQSYRIGKVEDPIKRLSQSKTVLASLLKGHITMCVSDPSVCFFHA